MPYASDAALPERIRRRLPLDARAIFRAAFNAAFKSYAKNPRREEIAHRVAWTAVKRRFVKHDEHWINRDAHARNSP